MFSGIRHKFVWHIHLDSFCSDFYKHILFLKLGYPVFLAPLIKDAVFPPVCIFGIFVKYQMAAIIGTHVWVFYFVL